MHIELRQAPLRIIVLTNISKRATARFSAVQLYSKNFIFWLSVYKCWKRTRELLLHKYFYVNISWFNIYMAINLHIVTNSTFFFKKGIVTLTTITYKIKHTIILVNLQIFSSPGVKATKLLKIREHWKHIKVWLLTLECFHFTLKDNLKKYDLAGIGHLANIKNCWAQEIVSLICRIVANSYLSKSLENVQL